MGKSETNFEIFCPKKKYFFFSERQISFQFKFKFQGLSVECFDYLKSTK